MKTVAVNGTLREELGKKGASSVRREERIPCVVYGGGDVVHFSTTYADLRYLVYTSEFKTAEVNVDGKSYRAILKDVQFHPVTDEIVHADFLRLIDGTTIKVELPIHFKGVSPGIKSGGKLQQLLRRISVKTTPEHLVEELEVDISSLELGQSIRIRDVDVTEGIDILMSPSVPVAMVEVPRALRSAEELAAEEAAEAAAEAGEGEEGAAEGEEGTEE